RPRSPGLTSASRKLTPSSSDSPSQAQRKAAMNTGRLARICVVLCSAAVIGAVPSTASSATSATQSAVVPSFAHVVVVVMENKSASSIIGNTSQASYINGLAAQYSYASNDFAISHPSLPNYLALTGASTFGITSDCSPAVCPVNATNLMDRIESAGRSWKAYMESMPASCATSDAYPYAVKHNPFVYYNDIRTNASRCQSHVVPFTQLSTDLRSASTTPSYAWITPNMCNDMHDCSIATGDAWLKAQVPAILSSPAFTSQHSLLALTWDEDDFTGTNQVEFVLAGSQVKTRYVSSTGYDHYSLLCPARRSRWPRARRAARVRSTSSGSNAPTARGGWSRAGAAAHSPGTARASRPAPISSESGRAAQERQTPMTPTASRPGRYPSIRA